MGGTGDVKAGQAFVELLLKDSAFVKGLKAAGKKLEAFGKSTAKVGATVSAAGAAIKGAMTAALHHFAAAGSELHDMSIRTGIAGTALAELSYAAEQSGASLGDVEVGVKKMQKFLNAASDATGAEAKQLREMGLSLAALKSMSPDQQFQAIADNIAAIQDPTKRAAMAMKVFGKSGTGLLPMITELAALRQEAKDLGIAPTDDDLRKADAVGDAFDRIKSLVKAVTFNVGAALADSFLGIAKTITTVAVTVNKWVKQNRALFVTISAVGTGLLAAGAAIAGFGMAISAVGSGLAAIASGLGVVASIVGVVLSPLGLITAALVGGIYAWTQYTTAGRNAVSGIMSLVGTLATTFKTTFGGIADAIMGGDLGLAGQIAMAGLKLALLQGWEAITAAWGPQIDATLDFFTSAWTSTTDFLSSVWSKWGDSIIGAFTAVIDSIRSHWSTMSREITEQAIDMMGTFDNLQKKNDAMDANAREHFKARLAVKREELERAKASSTGTTTTDLGEEMSVDELTRAIADLEKSLGYFSEHRDVRDEAKKVAATQAAAEARPGYEAPTKPSRAAAKATNAASAAEAELAELRKRSAKLAEEARARDESKSALAAAAAGNAGGGDMAARVAGSFSAAALQAMGQGEGSGVAEKQLEEQKMFNKHLLALATTNDEILRIVTRNGGFI